MSHHQEHNSEKLPPSNLMRETLLSFSQAAELFPPFRLGKPVGPSCVWRWFRHGVRIGNGSAIRLEAVRIAGRHLTSVEAIRRFVDAQQKIDEHEAASAVGPKKIERRKPSHEGQ